MQGEVLPALPILVSGEGERAGWRFLEFFTVDIRNLNTRVAYTHAAELFLSWCEVRGISELRAIQPMHVAGYIEQLQKERLAPTVKQHLACLRMLFDWLVTRQVIPSNPLSWCADHGIWNPRPPETSMFDPDANMPRLNRGMVCLGACMIAGIRLAREKQVHVRVIPTSVAIDESVELAHEIFNRVFRNGPVRIGEEG